MFDIKLQIGCLVIILFMSITYANETKKIPCNKYFDILLFLIPWAVIFDAASFLTINHMEKVPAWVNYGAHLLFFVLMDLTLIFSALYMFDNITGFRDKSKLKLFVLLPGLIVIVLTVAGIGNLRFVEGVHTNYSWGFSVYVSFASVFLYYALILGLTIVKHKYLPKQKRFGVLSFMTLGSIVLIIQIIFPETLLTSLAATLLVFGIYVEFENPSIKKMEVQNKKMVDNFATLVESRDNSTGGHIKRTRTYVSLLLKRMQYDPLYAKVMTHDYISDVSEAAPLHDIGKISTPDEILQKPGKLTDEEYAIMKEHAAKGGDIIQNVFNEMKSPEAKQIAYEVARHHHEKFNGKGYPDGLVGEQIPLHARVMAIADVFDAISQKRCYREAMPLEQCFEIIEKGAGTDFDPHLVALFLEMKDVLEEICIINREL